MTPDLVALSVVHDPTLVGDPVRESVTYQCRDVWHAIGHPPWQPLAVPEVCASYPATMTWPVLSPLDDVATCGGAWWADLPGVVVVDLYGDGDPGVRWTGPAGSLWGTALELRQLAEGAGLDDLVATLVYCGDDTGQLPSQVDDLVLRVLRIGPADDQGADR